MRGSERAFSLFHHQLRSNLLALLVALTAIGGGIYYLSEEALIKNVENNLQYHADFRKERVLSLFEEQKQWVREVSDNSGLSVLSEKLLNSYLVDGIDSSVYQEYRDYFRSEFQTLLISQGSSDLFLITPEGELAFSLRPMEEEIGIDLSSNGFYGETSLSRLITETLKSGQLSISRYGKIEQVEDSTVLMGSPITSSFPGAENEIIGILVRPFALKRLHTLLKSYEGLGETGEAVIAQWRGEGLGSGVNFISHFRFSEAATPDEACQEKRRTQPRLFPVLHALSRTNGAGWMIDNSCNPVYGVWTWIPELEWGMVVKQDQSEIMQPVRSMRNNILLTFPFILLFLVWMVHRQARTLAQPIEQLINASESGEITSLSSSPITEVNQLTLTLQQMLLVLQANQESLDKKVQLRTLQLKQQSGEMESILTSIQEGLLVIDQNCRVIRANQKIATLLGYEQIDQLNGIAINTLFVDADIDNADLFRAITETNSLSTERMMRNIDGEDIPVQISVAQLKTIDDEHHTDGAVLIAHDLRERIQAEKERTEQANRLSYQEGLAEMSTNVLHNIGNAIAGLNGRAEAISSTLGPLQQIQQQLEHAGEIEDLPRLHQGIKQLSSILQQLHAEKLNPSCDALIQGILHISEIITIQQQMAFGRPSINSRFSLKESIQKVISLHQDSNQKLGITIHLSIDPQLNEVTLPQNQFMQMIDNLIKNGREAISEQLQQVPSVSHTIHLDLTARGDDQFQLAISDSGIGIPHDRQQQIFQRNVTTKTSGTGIGLHSVSTFVHSLHGTISVQSDGPGQGSTFIIQLPRDGSKTTDQSL